MSNANNHALGEQIKAQQAMGGLGAAVAPTKAEAVARAEAPALSVKAAAAAAVAPDRETALIKGALDRGVGAREAKHELALTASKATADFKSGASILKADLTTAGHDMKADLSSGARSLQQDAHAVGDRIAAKVEKATAPSVPTSDTRTV